MCLREHCSRARQMLNGVVERNDIKRPAIKLQFREGSGNTFDSAASSHIAACTVGLYSEHFKVPPRRYKQLSGRGSDDSIVGG